MQIVFRSERPCQVWWSPKTSGNSTRNDEEPTFAASPAEPGDFPLLVKDIQKRLAGENILLNSFIVTPTRFGKLNWGKTIQELNDMHVLFMEDQCDAYVASIIRRMAA